MKLFEFYKKTKALATQVKITKTELSAVKLSQEQLADGNAVQTGSIIQYDGEIEQGDVIYLVDPAGNLSVLPPGSYTTKSGTSFVIEDGTVSSVNNTTSSPDDNKEPIKQAQSKDEEINPKPQDSFMEKEITKPAIETALADQPGTATITVGTDDLIASAIASAVASAIAPFQAQLDALSGLLLNQTTWSKETETKLKAAEEKIVKLSNEPAGQPAEKEINTFTTPAVSSKDIKMKRASAFFADNK